MIKVFSKRSLILLISVIGIGAGVVLACAGDAGPEYGTSAFTPEVFVDSAYSPFFYSNNYYYGIGHDVTHDTRFNEVNILEWYAYFKKKYAASELDILLDSTSTSAIDSLASWFNGKLPSPPPSLRSLDICRDKGDKNAKAFIQYLRLAKLSEAFAINNLEYAWDYSSKRSKSKDIDVAVLNKSLQTGMSTASNLFLKERYWFQLVRSNYFNGSPQDVIQLFDSHEKEFRHDTMYYRTLAYMAGAYYKVKDYIKANYYYSLVYAGSNELKTVAHYSFHPQDEKDWKATLALCRNTSEQATLWQMLGVFYSDPQRAIDAIYQLDPKSDKLDLLLSRAINTSEQRLFEGLGKDRKAAKTATHPTSNPYATASSASGMTAGDSSDQALIKQVTRIAEAGNTAKPWIWFQAAGYLHMLYGQYSMAATEYGKAEKAIPSGAKLPADQLRILKLLNKVASAKTIGVKQENEWREDIDWLWTRDTSRNPALRYDDAYNWICKTLAARYWSAGAYVKSECYVSSSLFYSDNRNAEAMKAFLQKPSKTPYEDLCARHASINLAALNEFQAIRMSFGDSIELAISALNQAGNGATATVLPGNPFNGRINDCHDCDHAAPQKIKYTKLSFLQKLKEMEDKIKTGQEVYTNAVLLGNAFYNMSHYGNARVFYECKIMGSGQSDPFIIDSVFRGLLTDMKVATGYYTQAFNAAKTDEQRAKCQYLLAKCQRNQWYNATLYNNQANQYSYYSHKGPDFIAWDGFKALRQYSNTQYYNELINECGYFKTYLKK